MLKEYNKIDLLMYADMYEDKGYDTTLFREYIVPKIKCPLLEDDLYKWICFYKFCPYHPYCININKGEYEDKTSTMYQYFKQGIIIRFFDYFRAIEFFMEFARE